MKTFITLACAMILFPFISCTKNRNYDSSPVASLELTIFLGQWSEIARFDHSFDRDMDNVMAEYSLNDDGTVKVLNSGWKDGVFKTAEGKAKCPDPKNAPAHLKVSFFLFFYSDYNVMYLDENYEYALIGSESDKYLWILSRKPELTDDAKASILAEASRRGYDTDGLIWVKHDGRK